MVRRGSVHSEIKSACDILRRDDGTSGVTDYMEQLSWLLFLKIFEGIEEELEKIAEINQTKYIEIIDKKYRWSNWAHRDWIGKSKDSLAHFTENIDEEYSKLHNPENTLIYFIDNILFPYLKSISGTSEKEKIAQIFSEISGNKMRSTYNFLDVIDKIDHINPNNYEDTHIISQFYEGLLLEMGNEAGWSGEFYTPRPVVEFIVNTLKPKIGMKIYDPFCGSGGFLAESFKYIKEELGSSITIQDNDLLQSNTFFGQDKKPLPYLCGTMNLILHSLLNPNYYRRNTLMEDVHSVSKDDKYDLIITNPPFGGTENLQVQNNFMYHTSATEALSLQYVMRKIKDKGKVGIILPEGQIMFGSGTFKLIRKELLEKFNVFSIVSLPKGVFTSMGTGVKTNIIFFEKTGQPTKEIWYYELKGKFSKTNPITKDNFMKPLEMLKQRKLSENSWIMPIKDIKNNDYNLLAKNPNETDDYTYENPKDLVLEIEELNNEIKDCISDLKRFL
ncbi:N-6 DNA methylase [Methanobacterium formicicum]|uniref:site-specific DNA-methyltransferase (adenine-specific) n=1 Tax=Methanobacterium formicicum (strain DSM 3637 / PP1) TaxID=1204725 RepID=K2R205_METFP|nr:N-6 DNA methylase [Methanobacterium formicicum]EKF86558.1 N-6 DNA methylase [Methanobacterium formicicum DSM 3637]